MRKKFYVVVGILLLAILGSFFVSKNLLQGSLRTTDTDSRRTPEMSVTHNDEPRLLPYPIKPSDFDFIANKYGRDVFSLPLRKSRQVDDGTPTPTLPPRVYKIAFVNVQWGKNSLYKNFSADQVSQIDKIRLELPVIFSNATYGLAALDTSYSVVNLSTELSSHIFNPDDDMGVNFRTSQFLPEFYLKNPDDFDFIYFYVSAPYTASQYNRIKADYSGGFFPNGKDGAEPSCFNNSKKYNSTSSKLKGTITMRRFYNSFPQKLSGGLSYYDYLSQLIGKSITPDDFGQFLEQFIALHEIEHAWSLHVTPMPSYFAKHSSDFPIQKHEIYKKLFGVNLNPLDYNSSHFGQLVETQESADPHDAIQFDLTVDNRVKICLNNLPPFKPYTFSSTVLYFMGFGYNLDYDKKYKFLNNSYTSSGNLPSPLPQSLVVDDYDDGCFYYKTVPYSEYVPPSFDTYTLNDIKTLYPDIHQCK